jgi:hypothetical protein
MSDERIERLTELARRIALAEEPDVRPELHTVEVERLGDTYTASALLGRVRIEGHPRALDALEAALLVLAGEPPAWVAKLCAQWEYEADALMQRVADSPDDPSPPLRTTAATMYVYAAELCERAKKESR